MTFAQSEDASMSRLLLGLERCDLDFHFVWAGSRERNRCDRRRGRGRGWRGCGRRSSRGDRGRGRRRRHRQLDDQSPVLPPPLRVLSSPPPVLSILDVVVGRPDGRPTSRLRVALFCPRSGRRDSRRRTEIFGDQRRRLFPPIRQRGLFRGGGPLRQHPIGAREVAGVAVRVALEIILMLGLGLPERAGRRHFGHHLAWP